MSAATLAQAVDAALAWWREAGVDGDWLDVPQDWLTKAHPAPKVAQPATEVIERIALAGGQIAWPTNLGDFSAWWMDATGLAPPGARRIPPAGPANAALMVVVPMPEAADTDTLLSDQAGRLLDGFLAAAGLTRAQVYCAAALPARITAPDWAALADSGLGDLLVHHIGLVCPQRLMLFGQNGISTLLGNGLTNNPTNLQLMNHEGAGVAALTVYDLEAIAARPALKAGLWSRWLDWMPA